MKQVLRVFVSAVFAAALVTVAVGPSGATNFYYFSEKKPDFASSQLTDHYDTSPFSPKIEMGKITHIFPANVRRLYWIGKTDLQTKPYELYAVWYRPDGTERQRDRSRWNGTSHYRSLLKLPKKKGPELLGQWLLQIEDATGDVLLRERFYVGPARNIVNADPLGQWTNPAYDLAQADAVVLLHDVRYKVSKEQGITRTIYRRIKILTEEGKDRKEFYEPYKERQYPRIKFAHTVKPDGSLVTDAQQFVGVLQKVPPHYRSARVMFVRMLQAEAGDILEYEMIFEEPLLAEEDLVYDEFLVAEELPVLEARYTVIMPDALPLRYGELGGRIAPTVTRIPAAAQTQYSWVLRDIPPVVAEAAMPPYRELGESIVVGTAQNWEQVAAWWQDHTRKKLQLTEEIQTVVREIRGRQNTSTDALRAVIARIAGRVVVAGVVIDDAPGWSAPVTDAAAAPNPRISGWITGQPFYQQSVRPGREWRSLADRWIGTEESLRKLTDAQRDTGEEVRVFLGDLYEFVRYEIEPVGFDYAWADPEPVPAGSTLEKRSGDSKNQVVLLRALLRAAGFESETVMLRTAEHGRLATDVYGLGEFNQMVALTRIGNEDYFLDPLSRYYREWTLPARFYGSQGVVVSNRQASMVTIPPQDQDSGHVQVDITLNMNKEFEVRGKLRIEYFGRVDAEMKNEFNSWDQNATAAFLLKQLQSYVPGGNYNTAELFNQEKRILNSRIQLGLLVTQPWITGEAPWEVPLIGSDALYPDYIRQERVHPVHLRGLRDVRITSRVSLPGAVTIREVPEDILVENDYLAYSARFQWDGRGRLTLKARYREKRKDIAPEDYDAFRKSYEQMVGVLNKPIYLIPALKKPADPVVDTP